MECEVCNKEESNGFRNGVSICNLCKFFIKYKSHSFDKLIKLWGGKKYFLNNTKEDFKTIFLRNYSHILKGNILYKQDFIQLKKDIKFKFDRLCLKHSL